MMRLALLALVLLGSTARADVLGLKFGMTAAQVRAAKPCKGLVANPAKGVLTCNAVAFAGTTMAAKLRDSKNGLAQVQLAAKLGGKRKAAELAADAILDKLVAAYGPLAMVGGPRELDGAAALFDNVDGVFTKFKGKLASAATFQAHSDDGTRLSGKLVRERNSYAIELSLMPDTP